MDTLCQKRNLRLQIEFPSHLGNKIRSRHVLIVVTGGAGFIGKHLVNGCLKNYDAVTVIDKASRPPQFSESPVINYRHSDAADIASILPKRKASSLRIVHLAAETSVQRSMLRPLSGVQSNVALTCSLLEFARKRDV